MIVKSARKKGRIELLMACLAAAAGGVVHAQVAPFEEVTTLSSDVIPVERSFDIPQSGTSQYRVTLTDIGAQFTVPAPAPLESVKLLITRGKTVVATLDGADTAGPIDTVTFAAIPGTYVAHVTGKPGSAAGSGPISLLIENVASSVAVLTVGATLSPPVTVDSKVSTYQTAIDLAADGTYQFTLADLQFPGPLQTAGVFVFKDGDSMLSVCLSVPEIGPCPATTTVPLTAGKYQVIAAGAIPDDGSSEAGVFSVFVRAMSDGAVIHSRAVEIGAVHRISSGSFTLNAGQHTLRLKDFAFPAAFASASTLVTRAAQVTAIATQGAPNAIFTVAADGTAFDVFAHGSPDVVAGAGSYQVEVLRSDSTSALTVVEAIGTGTSTVAYAYPVSIATAGAYRAKLGDFQFSSTLNGSRLAVVQNGAVVGKTNAGDPTPLTLDVANLAASGATVIAIANPSSTSAAFGLELTAAAGGPMLLAVAQGVGPLVSVRNVSVATAGKYDITLADLAFPAAFKDLTAVVSQGATRLGTLVVGSGNNTGGSATLFDFDASASNYSFTVIAQPSDTERSATYGIGFTVAPDGPGVTLTSDSPTVRSGSTTKLTWSSQNATTCTASSTPAGAWSGAKAVSGTESTLALSAATTFKLTCTGAGGRSADQSVSVTLAASAPSSSGGGGNFGWGGVFALMAIGLFACVRRARAAESAAADSQHYS